MKELVLRQTFLIAKGYFDPKEYFQAIKIDNLDDQTFDNKIKAMFNWSHHIIPLLLYTQTINSKHKLKHKTHLIFLNMSISLFNNCLM